MMLQGWIQYHKPQQSLRTFLITLQFSHFPPKLAGTRSTATGAVLTELLTMNITGKTENTQEEMALRCFPTLAMFSDNID